MSNHIVTSNGHLSNIKAGIDSLVVDSSSQASHDLLEGSIGHINNMNDLGSGSNQLRACAIGVMPSGNGRILSCSTDGHLNVDLQAGDINVGNVDIVSLPIVQDNILTEIESVDDRLDNTIGAVNNLSNLGAGSSLLKAASVAIMSGGNARILGCSDAGDLNVNVASGAITGFATEITLGEAEAHLGNIDVGIDAVEACVGTTGAAGPAKCMSVGGTQSDGTQRELTTDADGHLQVDVLNHPANITGFATETTLDAIKTAVELLDDCVDTAHLNVNLNIDGGDVDSSSGNLSSKTQRICLATDDIPIALVNTKLDTISGKITQGEANISGGGDGLQQILVYGKDQSGNLDPINVDNNGHLKITIQDIESGITNPINVSIDAVEACVGITGSAGAAKCISVGGTQSDGTQRELATDADGHLQVDVLNHPSNITGFATETTLGAIQTAVELIDDCVSGTELQVDIVGGGFDGVVSGAVTATLSTADNAVLDSIATSVQLLDDCVAGTELQVDIVGGNITGFATEITLGEAEAHLGNIDVGIDAVEACVGTTGAAGPAKCMSVGGTQSDGTQRELTTDADGHLQVDVLNHPANITGFATETTLDAIKTAVELLDDCVDTAHLNVNLNIQGGDVDSSSGNLSAKTQRICLATDDIPTAAVNANLVLLEATLETIKVDTEAIETAVESVAGCVSGTELQVDIVSGGGNATARLDIATGAAELANNELSVAADCSAFSEICVAYPTSKTNNQLKLFVKGSTTTGGTYYTFANMVRKEFNATDAGSGDTQHYVWGTGQDQYNAGFIPCVYPFIKIENKSGESFADSDNIRIVGR